MCVMPACQDEDRAPQCARKKDIAETCKKTCTEKEEKVGKPKEEIAVICRKECIRAIAETVFGGDFASALRNAVNTQTASITFDFAIFNPHVRLTAQRLFSVVEQHSNSYAELSLIDPLNVMITVASLI